MGHQTGAIAVRIRDLAADPCPGAYFDSPPRLKPTDLRPYDSEPQTPQDLRIYRKLRLIPIVARSLPRMPLPIASRLFGHWLGNSGTPVAIRPDALMRRSGTMHAAVRQILRSHHDDAVFDSGWQIATFAKEENPDLYYAIHNYRYRVRGCPPNREYTVDFYKRYNFGTAEECKDDLSLPLIGRMPQCNVAHLHTVGLAQDFDVHGTALLTISIGAELRTHGGSRPLPPRG